MKRHLPSLVFSLFLLAGIPLLSFGEEAAQNFLVIAEDDWTMDPQCQAQAHIFNENPTRPIRFTLRAESWKGSQKTTWRDTLVVQPRQNLFTGCINPTKDGQPDTRYYLESSQF